MKKGSIKFLFTTALAGCILAATGCSSDPQTPESTDEAAGVGAGQVTPQQGGDNTCCSSGGYTCSTDPNVSIDYDPIGCGSVQKPGAKSKCVQLCKGGGTCIDSGWISSC